MAQITTGNVTMNPKHEETLKVIGSMAPTHLKRGEWPYWAMSRGLITEKEFDTLSDYLWSLDDLKN